MCLPRFIYPAKVSGGQVFQIFQILELAYATPLPWVPSPGSPRLTEVGCWLGQGWHGLCPIHPPVLFGARAPLLSLCHPPDAVCPLCDTPTRGICRGDMRQPPDTPAGGRFRAEEPQPVVA